MRTWPNVITVVEDKEVVSTVAFGAMTTPSPIVSKSPGGASQDTGPRKQHLDPTEQPIALKNQICTQGGSQGACHQKALKDKGTADCQSALREPIDDSQIGNLPARCLPTTNHFPTAHAR